MKKHLLIYVAVFGLIISNVMCVFADIFPTKQEGVDFTHNMTDDVDDIVIYDAVGNIGDVAILDRTGPQIKSLCYDEEKYVVTIEDMDSGLWKIEDENSWQEIEEEIEGNIFDIEYGDIERPNKITKCTIRRDTVNSGEIRVYDHAGNYTVVILEDVPPVYESITYSGNYYIIRVSDPGEDDGTGSGIWKVVDNNGSLLEKVSYGVYRGRMVDGLTFLGALDSNGNILTGGTIYDRVGNTTTYILERTSPIVGPITYSGEYYTIEVSDPGEDDGTGSGIWKVEDNNGDVLEKVSDGVYRGRMVEDTTSKNVIGGFVHDKAGNKSPYSLETVLPIISYVDYASAPGESTVGYNEGHYMITVTDPGENTSGGTGSGIWVITDS
ncbi:MAG: hypothetical protein J6Y29_04070, partial [Clostridiales bacterium]|nr:hypothetical protein [Clostridiales bacterium]